MDVGAWLFKPGPSEEELALIGLTFDDIADQQFVEVWPENQLPVEVFYAMGTQWRHGYSGPVGMVYSEIDTVIKLGGFQVEDMKQLFTDLQVLERAALGQIAENQKQVRGK